MLAAAATSTVRRASPAIFGTAFATMTSAALKFALTTAALGANAAVAKTVWVEAPALPVRGTRVSPLRAPTVEPAEEASGAQNPEAPVRLARPVRRAPVRLAREVRRAPVRLAREVRRAPLALAVVARPVGGKLERRAWLATARGAEAQQLARAVLETPANSGVPALLGPRERQARQQPARVASAAAPVRPAAPVRAFQQVEHLGRVDMQAPGR